MNTRIRQLAGIAFGIAMQSLLVSASATAQVVAVSLAADGSSESLYPSQNNILIFGHNQIDTDKAVYSSSVDWYFTSPITGMYSVSVRASIQTVTTVQESCTWATNLYVDDLQKEGAVTPVVFSSTINRATTGFTSILQLNKGQKVQVMGWHNCGGGKFLGGSGQFNGVSIAQIGGVVGPVSSGTVLPLLGRFSARLTYSSYGSNPLQGEGTAWVLSNNTGYFGTVDKTSADVTVKIVDFCSYNNTYSVYIGGTTDINTTVNIHDNVSGRDSKSFVNPLGNPFSLIRSPEFPCK